MNVLIVLAKAPQPGKVKTRLCPPLAPREAAKLAEAFLRDALEQYAGLGIDVRLYLDGSWNYPTNWLKGASVHKQSAGGLGARLTAACHDATAAGYTQMVVIGTDHPTLPSERIMAAFESLKRPDSAVIGPTADGGFYLLGMNPYADRAFAGTFSHKDVFRQTRARLAAQWAHVHILPAWYDVDSGADLEQLRRDMRTHKGCPHTRAALSQIPETP